MMGRLGQTDTITEEVRNQAIRASRKFRLMCDHEFTPFVRVISRDRNMRVIPSGRAATNGKEIFLPVPMELGDDVRHDVSLCDKRDDQGIMMCPLCAIIDEVRVNALHECAHIVYKSFENVSEGEKRVAMQKIVGDRLVGHPDEIKLREILREVVARSSNMAELCHGIDNWLLHVWNSIEDVAVNAHLFDDRPGVLEPFHASDVRLFNEGLNKPDGTRMEYYESHPDLQASIALYLLGSGMSDLLRYLKPEVAEAILSSEVIEATMNSLLTNDTVTTRVDAAITVLTELRSLGFMEPNEYKVLPPQPKKQPQDQSPGAKTLGYEEKPQPSPGKSDDEGDDAEDGDDDGDGEAEGAEQDNEQGQDQGQEGQGKSSADHDSKASADQSGEGDSDGESDQDGTDQGSDQTDQDGTQSTESGAGQGDQGSDDAGASAGATAGKDDSGEGSTGDGADESHGEADEADESDDEADDDAGASGHEDEADHGDEGEENSHDAEGSAGIADPDDIVQQFSKFQNHPEEGHSAGAGNEAKPAPMTDEENDTAYDDDYDEDEDQFKLDEFNEMVEQILKQMDMFDEVSPGLREVVMNDRHADAEATRAHPLLIPERELAPALAKMRVAFTVNKAYAMEGRRPSGPMLDAPWLGQRLATGDYRHVHAKRIRPAKRNYCVIVTGDFSGSMDNYRRSGGTSRLDVMKMGLTASGELFHRLGIYFEMYAHSGSSWDLWLETIKGPQHAWDQQSKKAIASIRAGGGCWDGHTMEYMRKRAEAHPASDKIILYFSDGDMPACDPYNELRIIDREIKHCRDKNIHLLCVGIGTDEPKDKFGLDTIRYDDLSMLPQLADGLRMRLQ